MKKMTHKSDWAIGGCVIAGLGVGMLLLPNGLAFAASILIGLGVGLVITAFISRKEV